MFHQIATRIGIAQLPIRHVGYHKVEAHTEHLKPKSLQTLKMNRRPQKNTKMNRSARKTMTESSCQRLAAPSLSSARVLSNQS